MRRFLAGIALCLMLALCTIPAVATGAADAPPPDLSGRLDEIFRARSQWLLSDGAPPPLAADYLPGSSRAKWALQHEQGKIKYVKTWAESRGVKFVEAIPSLYTKYLSGDEGRARFYVGQTLSLGYVYPGEQTVNRFGVGSRHVLELRRHEEKWVVASEWYSDPLGDDSEVPDVMPSLVPEGLPLPAVSAPEPAAAMRKGGYDRQGAIAYADKFCGLAAGCGNGHRYNAKYRNYTGDGGDCSNFLSQILREGGRLRIPPGLIRVSNMTGYLQGSGQAWVVARAPFHKMWKQAAQKPRGFLDMVGPGDVVAFQLKGKMEHIAIITGFDSHGYPMVNSHTADRYRAPFDLGWDRKTVYWFLRMAG
ncbi:MAG TPA: amidase domain-containing protein [Symbiobacteriaceae bacterium]|jgi:hypothetical protein|nr:amidase domain-containing protein [Symbiobacteriaceae bacterium]